MKIIIIKFAILQNVRKIKKVLLFLSSQIKSCITQISFSLPCILCRMLLLYSFLFHSLSSLYSPLLSLLSSFYFYFYLDNYSKIHNFFHFYFSTAGRLVLLEVWEQY